MNKLEKFQIITGGIVLLTGLHIGAGKEVVEIGGIDNPVVKNPLTGFPYIPGSSLKGKMRCLLELKEKKYTDKGGPCNCGNCDICRTFGNTNKDSKDITRVLFRDAFLSDDSVKKLSEKELLSTEEKTENTVDRLTGTALHPRTTERVIAGLAFDFEIALRVFENDGDTCLNLIKEGMSLLEKDTLGGSGSRGYGKIEFKSLKLDGKDFSLNGERGQV
ncbi:MAG: type III-A CRISPR-associated RAMP protein Csm3 [Spirochaetales bacterium]|nr:type III-A CRISPR-associated RAMP protein Csm3 [Spirochaetales bacterium]